MQRTAGATLLVLMAILLSCGLLMLYSTTYAVAAEATVLRQGLWILVGLAAALVLRQMDYRVIGRWSSVLLALFALSLAYLGLASLLHGRIPDGLFARLPFVASEPTKGSFRWLSVWRFSLQPSEFAKIGLILFLADYYHKYARFGKQFLRGVAIPLGVAGGVCVLTLLGHDLSTTVIIGSVAGSLAFVAGVRLRYLVLVATAGILATMLMIAANPERMARWLTYKNPEAHQFDEGYQLWASQLALGSGGWHGLGFTNSRMKQRYLPEASTDFIVAIVGEELGFVAVATLVLLYTALTACLFWAGTLAVDRMGLLFCGGLGLLFGIQAFINIAVVSGFCPTTGVTAPFLSYGGSSVVAGLMGIGVAFSVLRIAYQEAAEQGREDRVEINDSPTLRTRALTSGVQPKE